MDTGIIEDFYLNPVNNWDPTEEELEIEFELTEEVDYLAVYAVKGSTEIEIYDKHDANDVDYELEWDGEDNNNDYVSAGYWEIWVIADGDQVQTPVEVEYNDPQLVEALVTKDEIDNDEDEFVTLLFEVDEDALVTVEVYEGNNREDELVEDLEVEADTWYAVTWYALEEDGDEFDYDDYEFEITVKNEATEDVVDSDTVDFEVEEDEASSGKSNIVLDYTSPVVFDEDLEDLLTIHYCIDDEAEVSIEIYEGENASGSSEVELLDEYDQAAGCHTIEWNVTDEDGDELDEGVYTYEITTKVGSKKETEEGRFVVGDIDPEVGLYLDTPYGGGLCGAYWDTQIYQGTELCEALDWVTANGIFKGYDDGSFGVNKYINRAETFKVVLETFDVPLLPADGTTQGFYDLDPYEWYMPYVRTAVFYGMLEGYNNGTIAGLGYNINRAEILKFVLEGSRAFTGYAIPGYSNAVYADVSPYGGSAWIQPYAAVNYQYELLDVVTATGMQYLNPGELVTRGEVALLLYRMYKGGLI